MEDLLGLFKNGETREIVKHLFSDGGEISLGVQKMLMAGFPVNHHEVQRALYHIGDQTAKKMKSGAIPISNGVYLYMVPDHTGTLAPGEIFVQFSNPSMYGKRLLLGETLVYRAPVQVQSDFQKMEAVECPELDMYFDVVMFSTQGEVSPGSLLSGGDYDGDQAWIIWDERLLKGINCVQKLPPPEEVKDLVKPSNLGTKKIRCLKSLQEGLIDYYREQSKCSILGAMTAQLDDLMNEICREGPDPERVRKSLLLGNLCAKAVDSCKAGDFLLDKCMTIHAIPKPPRSSPKRDGVPQERPIDILSEIRLTSGKSKDAEVWDIDLAPTKEDVTDETVLRCQQLRNHFDLAEKTMRKWNLTSTERLKLARVYYLISWGHSLSWSKWKIFRLEYCQLKADAISARTRNPLTATVLPCHLLSYQAK